MNGEIQAGSEQAEKRRVVCSANLYPDGSLTLGVRHHDDLMRTQVEGWSWFKKRRLLRKEQQGFIDQWGVFMDRKEALAVALEAGQRIYRCGGDDHHLYSENLY